MSDGAEPFVDEARLSRSILWQRQRDYFAAAGLRAWLQVPSYVTSNAVIAEAYAMAVVRYLQDRERRDGPAAAPLYVIELGAGSGRFGCYVLRALQRLRRGLAVATEIRYVMTDAADAQLEALRAHRDLAAFAADGSLRFGRFDLEEDRDILLEDGAPLELRDHAVVVFANYVFDSVGHDLFYAADGALFEAVVRARPAGLGAALAAADYELVRRPVTGAYYGEARLDALLEHYRGAVGRGRFHLPIGALGGLDRLRAMAPASLLMLAADRGYDDVEDMIDRDGNGLAFHGSVSVAVNFDAIGRWVEAAGGAWYRPRPRRGLLCQAYLFGDRLAECGELRLALDASIDGFAPGDFFQLHKVLSANLDRCDGPALLGYLALSRWDPRALHLCLAALHRAVDTMDASARRALVDGLERAADNFFFVPGAPDTPFEIASLYQHLHEFACARIYYRRSELYFGANSAVTYNDGLCLAGLGRYREALACLRQVARSEGPAADVHAWIARIERELAAAGSGAAADDASAPG